MIIWEWMVENRRTHAAVLFQQRFEFEGITDMRILTAKLSVWLEDVWEVLPDDLSSGFSFDWEIVPALLERLDWEDLRLPAPQEAVHAISEMFGEIDEADAALRS